MYSEKNNSVYTFVLGLGLLFIRIFLSPDLSAMGWVADRRGQDPKRPYCNSQMFGQPVSYRGSDSEPLLKYRSNKPLRYHSQHSKH